MQATRSGVRHARRMALVWRSAPLLITLATGAGAQEPAPASPADTLRRAAERASPDTSAALARFLEEASALNSQLPERLRAYRAHVETEMSLSVLDSAGLERIAQLEQVASEVRWRASGQYEQRVVGHRSQAVGPMFSLMSMFGGWTTPTLYGNRLQLGVTPSSTGTRPEPLLGRGLAIHPLATNREQYYEFAGGDTVAVLQTRDRRIHVVSVRVTPRERIVGDAILFLGELHLDADRRQIVRMRGRMVEYSGGKPTISAGSRIPGASGASFVELVNAEFGGEFWLPVYQRTEMQARFALLGQLRAIVRIVSRFQDHRPNDTSWFAGAEAPPGVRHHLTFAPSDSLNRYGQWRRPIGEASDEVRYADFDDLEPEAWNAEERQTARIRFRPRTMGEVFRFNRIEGAFTGVALERDFREAGEGFLVRGSAGWAWSEQTIRGALTAERHGSEWTQGLRLERALAHTNDFTLPLSWGATFSALFGSNDDFDYVDRWSASASATHWLDAQRRSYVRFEAGPAQDRAVRQHASQGLFVEGDGFRPNRGIREGSYVRSVAALEINPQVSGMFVNRGIGARLQYERADGQLRWQRLEGRVAARRNIGPFELFARGDAGAVFGGIVPQALFEIGRWEGLSAYGYKEFGGDRAALGRMVAGYTTPWLRAPMRFSTQFILPGLAPGIAAGVQGGWAEASSDAARQALLELGTVTDTTTGQIMPLSRPTDGIRASGELLLTFFNGALALGVARPLDHEGPWRFTGRIGQGF